MHAAAHPDLVQTNPRMARNVVLTSITLRQLVAALQALEELLGLTPLYLDTLPRHLCRPSALSGRQQALLAPALRRRMVRVVIRKVALLRPWVVEQEVLSLEVLRDDRDVALGCEDKHLQW